MRKKYTLFKLHLQRKYKNNNAILTGSSNFPLGYTRLRSMNISSVFYTYILVYV